MKKYICAICGYIYDEAAGMPSAGIAPCTRWEELPEDWTCPLCGASKAEFKELTEEPSGAKDAAPEPAGRPAKASTETAGGKGIGLDVVFDAGAAPKEGEELRQLSPGELAALCSNLARGCEKQYLGEESALFSELAGYFQRQTPTPEAADVSGLLALLTKDLDTVYPQAGDAAGDARDRGAKRALVWGEKVSRILQSLFKRYEKDGDRFLENNNVYVCTVCGFVYVGRQAPELCPVCKVPSWKFEQIKRGA